MRTNRSPLGAVALSAAAAFLAAAAFPAPARAQVLADWNDQTCKEEVDDPARLGADPSLETPPKKGLKLNAKIQYVSGDQIIVYGNQDVPLKLWRTIVTANVLGAQGITDGDNITAYGYITAVPPQPGKFFLVLNIKKQEEDQKRYRAKIAEREKAGDMAGLFKLGEEIEAMGAQLKKPAIYGPLAREAYRAGIGLQEKKADDVAAWIAVAGEHLRLLGDRKTALDRLKNAIKLGKPGEPLLPEIQAMLDQLKASQYGGEYLLLEEVRQREGFVERGGTWVRREEAEFEDLIDEQRSRPVRTRKRFLPGYFQEAAAKQNVLLGMNKEELAQAIGFPEDVDRKRRGASVYDMWAYMGRGSFYFEDGELFKKPDAPK